MAKDYNGKLTGKQIDELPDRINEIVKDSEDKAYNDGYYSGMRVGNADSLTPNGDNAPVYEEIITAGRMVNDATDVIGDRVPSATGVSNITIKDSRGDVFGGNQMTQNANFSKGTTDWIVSSVTFTVKEGVATITKKAGIGEGTGYIYQLKETPLNRKLMFLSTIKANRDDVNTRMIVNTYAYWYTIKVNRVWTTYANITTIKTKPSINNIIWIADNSSIDTSLFIRNKVYLDLDTLFPTDKTFVNNLNEDDTIKVLHRLGFFIYNRDNTGITTQLEQETLIKGAEVIAKLGYQEPKFWYGSVGRIHLIDGNTGRKKQTLDMINVKKKAWAKVLEALTEQGITIPEFVQKPIEFSINDGVGVKWDSKGVTVSAWMVDLGSLDYTTPVSKFNTFRTNDIKNIIHYKTYNIINNLLTLKYTSDTFANVWSRNDEVDKVITINSTEGIIFKDSDYSSVAELKEGIRGQYLIYELDTPIRIDFDEEINLNLVDVKPYDLYALDDIEGNAMYDIDIEPQEDGTFNTTIAPKAEWVEEHQQLPVPIYSTIVGFGTNVNYDFIMKLFNDVQELKNKMV